MKLLNKKKQKITNKKLNKEEQKLKDDKKSRNNIRKKLVEYEKTVTNDPATRNKTQFLQLKKIIGKNTPIQRKKRHMIRTTNFKLYNSLKQLNLFEDIDTDKEEKPIKEDKLKDDDFSYLGITNEEAEELLGIKKEKAPSKKLSLDDMIKKSKQLKQDIRDLEEKKNSVKKTSDIADKIRSEITDNKEKLILLDRKIKEGKDKLEDEVIKQKEAEDNKQKIKDLVEFKKDVKKFIKKPTEELNDKILDNLDLLDELTDKMKATLEKALDRFEESQN